MSLIELNPTYEVKLTNEELIIKSKYELNLNISYEKCFDRYYIKPNWSFDLLDGEYLSKSKLYRLTYYIYEYNTILYTTFLKWLNRSDSYEKNQMYKFLKTGWFHFNSLVSELNMRINDINDYFDEFSKFIDLIEFWRVI